jgi:hypothetical protein
MGSLYLTFQAKSAFFQEEQWICVLVLWPPIDVWLFHHQERSMLCSTGIHTDRDGADQLETQWMTQTFCRMLRI